jgi:hypothetical protein
MGRKTAGGGVSAARKYVFSKAKKHPFLITSFDGSSEGI